MKKSIHSTEQRLIAELLLAARKEIGWRQQDLAARLAKPTSFISRVESGERVLDMPELRQFVIALGMTLPEFVAHFEAVLAKQSELALRSDRDR